MIILIFLEFYDIASTDGVTEKSQLAKIIFCRVILKLTFQTTKTHIFEEIKIKTQQKT